MPWTRQQHIEEAARALALAAGHDPQSAVMAWPQQPLQIGRYNCFPVQQPTLVRTLFEVEAAIVIDRLIECGHLELA